MDQDERDRFAKHCQNAARIVASWPAWKRGILEQSGKSMNEKARPVVEARMTYMEYERQLFDKGYHIAALQLAIEQHCEGVFTTQDVKKLIPRHAELLDNLLKERMVALHANKVEDDPAPRAAGVSCCGDLDCDCVDAVFANCADGVRDLLPDGMDDGQSGSDHDGRAVDDLEALPRADDYYLNMPVVFD